MANYLHWTGDREGLLAVNGGHIGRCDDGFWWLAPSCRSASSTCASVDVRCSLLGPTGLDARSEPPCKSESLPR